MRLFKQLRLYSQLLILALIGVSLFGAVSFAARAAGINTNCTLIVPHNPLSAKGLATPYQLVATDGANGPCNEANAMQTAFVQAAILDEHGHLTIYDPLVIDKGTAPAVAPALPTVLEDSIVAIWFGFNGDVLTLKDAPRSCVNGLRGSNFGQFAYCNAPKFFRTANRDIAKNTLSPALPVLGTGKDGQPCPTVRDFSIVDQDQSDNLPTTYLSTANGIAQNLVANANPNAVVLKNPSDNRLDGLVASALGCTPYMAPNNIDGTMEKALPLNELQAAHEQASPMALIPPGDPMVLVNGATSNRKVNLYRAGVDQPRIQKTHTTTSAYCQNILKIAPARLNLDKNFTVVQPSPDAAHNSLFTFEADRLNFTLSANGLNCVGLLNVANPVTVATDANGVVVDATITQ